MKVLTVLGTRPEIIRLSLVIERLDERCDHVLVHTGQNSDPALSDRFFAELGVREPDHHLRLGAGALGERLGRIFRDVDAVLTAEQPDRVLVLGDTDSGLAAFVAKRRGIPVLHMEAGNRCFDDRVPEEVNRRVIDHSSDLLLPYTHGSRQNLLDEGIPEGRIVVTGNPINEVMVAHRSAVERSSVLADLGLRSGGYLLLTAHRQENVDVPERLRDIVEATASASASAGLPVVCSVHPRTRDRLEELGLEWSRENVLPLPPFGFVDFVALERDARCVLTDSGTVQEECCLLGVPTVTIRDTTERPETVLCGSNVLSGVDPERVVRHVMEALEGTPSWEPPAEYLADDVSSLVAGLAVGELPDGAGSPG